MMTLYCLVLLDAGFCLKQALTIMNNSLHPLLASGAIAYLSG
jgi:hypothetical protein